MKSASRKTKPKPLDNAREHLTGTDLHGKELAAYLKRCVRTIDPFDRAHGVMIGRGEGRHLVPAAYDRGNRIEPNDLIDSRPRLVHESCVMPTAKGPVSIDCTGDALYTHRIWAIKDEGDDGGLVPPSRTIGDYIDQLPPGFNIRDATRRKTRCRMTAREAELSRLADKYLEDHQ